MQNNTSVMLLVSLFGSIHITAMQNSSDVLLSPRGLNSIMETYMSGRFAASKKSDHITCFDYKTGVAFEAPIENIAISLTSIHTIHLDKINKKESFIFHETLEKLAHKHTKIAYLNNLDETYKMRIQALRLYDFMEHVNMSVSHGVMEKFETAHTLSQSDKRKLARKIIQEQRNVDTKITANRLALAKAFETGNAAHILEACKQPLHAGTFLSLNGAIQKMISDIGNGSDGNNVLCNNYSRSN